MKSLTMEDIVNKLQLTDYLNRLESLTKKEENKKTWLYICLGVLGTIALVFIILKVVKKMGCCQTCDCNEYYEEGLEEEFEEDFEADNEDIDA